MSIETFALGVVSGLRPATSQAAVIALLKTPDPRRALLFFLVAGFLWSMAVGLVLVLAFHGARVTLGGSTFTALFDLVAGVAALAFAIGYHQGRVTHVPARAARPVDQRRGRAARSAAPQPVGRDGRGGRRRHPHPGPDLSRRAERDRRARSRARSTAAVQVAVYNALWFAFPIAALALAILRPGRAPAYLERATRWGRQHEQVLVVATLTALGVYLTVKGLVRLF